MLLRQQEIDAGLARLAPGWSGDGRALHRVVEFADFPTAVTFIGQLAPHCERLGHHPDLGLSWRTVTLTLTTHSAGGVTAADLALAEVIDAVIDEVEGASPKA